MKINPHISETRFEPPSISLKGRFPFSLACPSFVYPAGYMENIRLLAPVVDEIELLFFESRSETDLPDPALIQKLHALGQEQDLTYHLHLPMDIDPGHENAAIRKTAIHTLCELIDRTAVLTPATFTLHLTQGADCPFLPRWQAHAMESLKQVLDNRLPSRLISVENIDDQFNEVAAPIVEALDLSVCMDTGHLMLYQMDINAFFQQWQDRMTIIHFHGVADGKDHQPLDNLSSNQAKTCLEILNSFSGTVSLEVFSIDALNPSMAWMMDHADHLKAK
ncbi:sugar phosphate isomerase/epimerase [Desulfosarcina sp. OttesenSCG-928-A07]|nr:sugar phosphate isomerase/epimerase [Desulfosarcina sp. OttesenSCG-928-A07]